MSKSEKQYLRVSGITSDGKALIAGVFDFETTIGLPLEIILLTFKEKDKMVDWVDYYKAAVLFGMKHERIINRMQEANTAVYGAAWTVQWKIVCEKVFFMP